MSYITLTPEAFFDEEGLPSIEYISLYCQFITGQKFIYDGLIDCTYHEKLIFPNIVKGDTILTHNIIKKFPDLVEAKIFYYYAQEIPDIGNLKSVDIFHMHFSYNSKTLYNIKKYIKIIDENTVIINGKELNVKYEWKIGFVTSSNYKGYGL